MTKDEKFTSVAVYITKLVEHLQGAENEYKSEVRQNSDYPRGRRLSQALKVKGVLPRTETDDPSLSDTA